MLRMSQFKALRNACRIELDMYARPVESEKNLALVCSLLAVLQQPLSEYLSHFRASSEIFETVQAFDSLTDEQYSRLVNACSEVGLLEILADLLHIRKPVEQQIFRL